MLALLATWKVQYNKGIHEMKENILVSVNVL
jgi:hypothetical protein